MKPPVVIAENRVHAERRIQPRQFGGPDRRRNRLGHESDGWRRNRRAAARCRTAARSTVSTISRMRSIPHIGTAGMQIGDHRDGQLLAGRPAARLQPVACDIEHGRGLDAGIAGKGRARQRGNAQTAQQQRAARDQRTALGFGEQQVGRTDGFHVSAFTGSSMKGQFMRLAKGRVIRPRRRASRAPLSAAAGATGFRWRDRAHSTGTGGNRPSVLQGPYGYGLRDGRRSRDLELW